MSPGWLAFGEGEMFALSGEGEHPLLTRESWVEAVMEQRTSKSDWQWVNSTLTAAFPDNLPSSLGR